MAKSCNSCCTNGCNTGKKAKVEFYVAKDGYRWTCKAGNGEALAHGVRAVQGDEIDLLKKEVRAIMRGAGTQEVFTDKNGQFRFRIRSGKKIVAASTEAYFNAPDARRAMALLIGSAS